MKSIFSQNLIKARKQKGWSQQGAAQSIGIKRSLLGAYEEGRCEPPHDTMIKISHTYGIADWKRFITDEGYFGVPLSAEELEKRYRELAPPAKKAVDILLGIAC